MLLRWFRTLASKKSYLDVNRLESKKCCKFARPKNQSNINLFKIFRENNLSLERLKTCFLMMLTNFFTQVELKRWWIWFMSLVTITRFVPHKYSQCENLDFFLPMRFFVKSILVNFKAVEVSNQHQETVNLPTKFYFT